MSDSCLPKTFLKRMKAVFRKTVAGNKGQRGLSLNFLFGNVSHSLTPQGRLLDNTTEVKMPSQLFSLTLS